MTAVQTVTGAVDHTALGMTLVHEHVSIESPGLAEQYPWLYDRATASEHIVAELTEAAAAGVHTLVEVSPPDLGRNVLLYQDVSRRSGVLIVACTGIWLEIPHWFRDASVDQIAEVFAREIEQGIAGTSIRAGVIKVANNRDPGIGELQERVLRGAARAAARTGVPITTHTGPYDIGRDQMRVFADTEVPPHLVAIGHAFTGDLDYLHAVLAAGHYLSIDTFGRNPDREMPVLEAIATLCAEGYADRLMLSHDHAPEWDWRPHPAHEGPSRYTYVPVQVRPLLSSLGVSADDLERMLVTAPATFLAGGREA